MTTRISSLGQHLNLQTAMLGRQKDQFDTQNQVSTGLRSQDFKGIARDVSALIAAKAERADREHFQRNINELNRHLQIQENSMKEVREMELRLRDAVMTARGTNSSVGLMETVREIFSKTASIMNTTDGNRYIFGGSKATTAPCSTTDPATFLALGNGNSAQLFQNDTIQRRMQVDKNYTVSYGQNASTVVGDFMELLHQMLTYNAGTNPAGPPTPGAAALPAAAFSGTLNAQQTAFLDHIIQQFQTTGTDPLGDLDSPLTTNGLIQKNVKDVSERHEQTNIYLSGFISDIQDVDTAEAISRLNLNRMSFEASLRTLAQVDQLSLMQFL